MTVRYVSPRFQEFLRTVRFKPVSSPELRRIMERTRLSHSEIAHTLGVDRSTVWRWLEGETSPNQAYSILLRLLADRRVTEQRLLHYSSTPYAPPSE